MIPCFIRKYIFPCKITHFRYDIIYRTAAAGPTYPTPQQAGYAVAPAAAAAAATYNAQRTGYDQATYQATATQGTYASKISKKEKIKEEY